MSLPDISSMANIPFIYPFLIGFVMAINPCNMGVDLAGIAYVSLKLDNPRGAVFSGTFYTIGRALTYMFFGLLIFAFGSTISDFAPLLQTYENLHTRGFPGHHRYRDVKHPKTQLFLSEGKKSKYGLSLPDKGLLGALAMGAASSLALCPCTAVIFLGLLIPLSVKANIVGMSFPILFGIGTGVPILAFAILMGMSTKVAQTYLNNIVKYEPYVRKIFGAGFVIYGLYLLAMFLKII